MVAVRFELTHLTIPECSLLSVTAKSRTLESGALDRSAKQPRNLLLMVNCNCTKPKCCSHSFATTGTPVARIDSDQEKCYDVSAASSQRGISICILGQSSIWVEGNRNYQGVKARRSVSGGMPVR